MPGGRGGIGPAWTRGEIERPAGEKNMGTWTAAVYTPEQQARLGVDEQGNKRVLPAAAPAPAPVVAASPVGSVGTRMLVGGAAGLGPAWTRGEIERPAGEKDMGTWKAAVYTPEQQARLGVDEQGNKRVVSTPVVTSPIASVGSGMMCGAIGPAWTRGEVEKPGGTKNMGTWTAAVYTPEQQARLGVDEQGNKRVATPAVVTSPVASLGAGMICGAIGPAWTRGEIERPAGEKNMGTWTAAVYTPEQQARLGVDESGNKKAVTTPVVTSPVASIGSGMICGAIGPAWTRGAMEAPAGQKNMGTWTAAVYTPEQQARLGVDEQGNKKG